MLGLLLSTAALGLAAVDPLGIALILILLTQQNALRRTMAFMLGSFLALVCMGFLFARGLGEIIIRTENAHHWLEPSFQIIAGAILLLIGIVGMFQKASSKPPSSLVKYTALNDALLYICGFILVVVQSVLDVVFIVAMAHVASMHPSNITLLAAITAYTIAALSIQAVIIMAFVLTPVSSREKFMQKCNNLLEKYGQSLTIYLSLGLGALIAGHGILIALGWASVR